MKNSQLCVLIAMLWVMVSEITRRDFIMIYCFVWLIFALINVFLERIYEQTERDIEKLKSKIDNLKFSAHLRKLDTIIELLTPKKEKVKKNG